MQTTPYVDGNAYECEMVRNRRATMGEYGVDVDMRDSETGNVEYANGSEYRTESNGCACAHAIAAPARRRVTGGWEMRRVGTGTIQAWCGVAKPQTQGAMSERENKLSKTNSHIDRVYHGVHILGLLRS